MALFGQNRKELGYLVALLLLVGLLLGLMLNPFLTVVNHDSAIFCILAQSLLKGHYLLVSEPNPQPYFTFPPFLSVQLAGLMLLFQNVDPQAMQAVFKGYIDILFLLSLPLFYFWVRSLLGSRTAMVLTLLVGVNPIIFKYTTDILSDTPFWAFSMAAIFSVWQLQKGQDCSGKRSKRWFILSVALIILCALTRQIGMALVLAFLIALLLRRQWRPFLVALTAFALAVGGWQSYEHFYRSAHRSDISSLNQQGVQEVLDQSPIKLEYVKHFLVDKPVNLDENRSQANPVILAQNALERVDAYTKVTLNQLVPELKVKQDGRKVNLAHWVGLKVIVWVLFALGLFSLWRVFPFGGLYLSLYLGVLLVYPYISQRFLLPVYPLMLLCLAWGALLVGQAVLRKSPIRQPLLTGLGVILVGLALTASLIETIHWVHAGYQLKVAHVGPSLRKGNRAYYETLLWMKANTPENSLIIARKPPVVYFYSGRKSTAFPFTRHTDKLFAYVEEKQKRYGKLYPHLYIFEDTAFPESERFLKPVAEQYRQRLTLVYTEPNTQSRVWLLK